MEQGLSAWIQDKIDDMYFQGIGSGCGHGIGDMVQVQGMSHDRHDGCMKRDRGLGDMGSSLQVDTQDDDVWGTQDLVCGIVTWCM